MERSLICYRYYAWAADYDVELVWALVQRHGGEIALHRDSIDFWIPPRFETLLVLTYPELVRQPGEDYVKTYRYRDPQPGIDLPPA